MLKIFDVCPCLSTKLRQSDRFSKPNSNSEAERARGEEHQKVLVEVVEDDGRHAGKIKPVRSRIMKRNAEEEKCRVFNKKGWRICTD